MGKGDKKTKKGKIFMGSYGITRKRKKKKSIVIISKKKAVTAKSTLEKAAEVKKDVSAELILPSKTEAVTAGADLKDEGLNITKKPALSARPERSRSGAKETTPEKTQTKSGTKKTASKKTSVSTTLNMTKKTTIKKAATKKPSAKK